MLGKKLGDLFVNVSSKGVGQVNTQLGTTEQKATTASKAVNFLKTALLGIGAYAIINGIRSLIKEFSDYTVAIDKANKTTGVATEALQRLKYATDQEHASFEMLTKGLTQLSRRMQYARDDLETYTRVFNRLGVEWQDAQGNLRNVEDVFYDVIDAMQGLTNDTERVAAAMELFGRSGAEMVPFMKLGRQRIAELGKEAERLSVVLEDKTIKQGKEFSDKMTELNTAIMGVKLTIADELLPELQALSTTLTEIITKWKPVKTAFEIIRVTPILERWLGGREEIEEYINRLLGLSDRLDWVEDNVTGIQPEIVITAERMSDLDEETGEYIKTLDDLLYLLPTEEKLLARNLATLQDLNETRVEGSLALEDLTAWLLAYFDAQERVNKATREAEERERMRFTWLTNFYAPIFESLADTLLYSEQTWGDWANAVIDHIKQVMAQMIAMAALAATLSFMGLGPFGAIFGALTGLGGFQTPKGDWWAYREGRDFGKFFFSGFQERLNALTSDININQEPTMLKIYAEPGIIVERLANSPFNLKNKFHQDITLEVERRT